MTSYTEYILYNRGKSGQSRKLSKIIPVALGIIILLMISPLLVRALFLDLPGKSASFDCDDAVLNMYQRLSRLGITATPVVGDLKTTGEQYERITHIWLLVKVVGTYVALDWGSVWLDRQHFEGYSVSYEDLIFFVHQDFDAPPGSGYPANWQ